MTALQLAGVALAALLSENFILVNCLGIGVRTKAFHDPLDAWRTGYSLTAVMSLTALATWGLNQLLQHFALGYFQTLVFALTGPVLVAALRCFLKNCVPELSRRIDENLASLPANCAAMGAALLIAERGYSLLGALLFGFLEGWASQWFSCATPDCGGKSALRAAPRAFRESPLSC